MRLDALVSLDALEARLKQELSWLELPAKPWVIARSHDGLPMHEVVVIGAGMAGLAAATALRLMGVRPLILDRAPQGLEGPWVTTARMETLRSPKQLTGPALHLPSLTFRAWFEAQWGLAAWEALDKIPRVQWMDYLRWYRKVVVDLLSLDIRNDHRVSEVRPMAADRVSLVVNGAAMLARRVVLATGRDGLGSAWLPNFANEIPAALRAHSSDLLDYSLLKGKRVAVIGAGASAMDSAATALEAGAWKVDMLVRRAVMPSVNKGKGAGNPGLSHGFYALPDEWKWRFRRYINTQQVPPPRGSTMRVARHANASFHMGCPVLEVKTEGDMVSLRTRKGWAAYDKVIFSTGFRVNFAARPEFAPLAAHIRCWEARYQADEGDEDRELLDCPDLGAAFEFQEKLPGSLPGLDRVHCFCYPAVMSHGQVSGDIPAISEGAKRLAEGIAATFYAEDVDGYYARMAAYSEPELLGDEFTPAP